MKTITSLHQYSLHFYLYRSYWRTLLGHRNHVKGDAIAYFTARPNKGAGIGHQLANWIAGYYYAYHYHVNFSHSRFESDSWERFLGLGEGEVDSDTLTQRGYRLVLLPRFDENNKAHCSIIEKIIEMYKYKKVVLIAGQDQFLYNQSLVSESLKNKFFAATARKSDRLLFHADNFNIAIHIRRGDISNSDGTAKEDMHFRWQTNAYFLNVARCVINNLQPDKQPHLYIFSQGNQADFSDYSTFPNVHFCMEMGPQDSFLHMVFADLLITSKSSFSYKPALLSNGIKICPRLFWHGYPDLPDWILAEEDGSFDVQQLKRLV